VGNGYVYHTAEDDGRAVADGAIQRCGENVRPPAACRLPRPVRTREAKSA
jgi:hypothetical protein